MSANQYQVEYRRLKSKTIAAVGRFLASVGEPFDRELADMLAVTRSELSDQPEFAVWMAEALAWARYAVRDDEYFDAATRFIAGGDPTLADEASCFDDRFGTDNLRKALVAFRQWFDAMPILQSVDVAPLRWKALQERSLLVAEQLKRSDQFRGVGLWLFPAPFKILAVAHPEVWGDPTLEAIVMPTGTQVVRALDWLQRDGVIRKERSILKGSTQTFADEYTNLWALQIPQKELASAGGTSVLHINGALHELGWRGKD